MAEGPTPQQQFLFLFKSKGITLPESFDDPTMTPFKMMVDLTELVVPLEGQNLVVLAMLLLNGPYRLALAQDQITLLNDKLVAVIYEMMPHPPRNLAAQDFRSVDGADRLGAANMPYAKSVISNPRSDKEPPLPSPQEVFNKLMLREQTFDTDGKRTEKVVDNPDGLSALTFAYGTLVVHSVFRSGLADPKINETSSFFDLSPLYGDDIKEQLSVRNRNGRGLLAPDCFVDDRMLSLPPAAAALLVIFNRNHNHIAGELLEKESVARKWDDPSDLQWDTKKRNKQDDEIFELARLINCVHFVNIVITDYVGGIMGRTKGGGGWPLDAKVFDRIDLPDRAITYANAQKKDDEKNKFQKASHVSRGDGNLVSIEFNTLYRWHATLSEKDVQWTEGLIASVLGHDQFDKVSPMDFVRAVRMAEPLNKDPKQSTFNFLKRNVKTNKFDDNALAKIIFDATDAPAGAFRAKGSPLDMLIYGIQSWVSLMSWAYKGPGRWGECSSTCTMNEFREWLGLPKYTSFKEWNEDPVISAAASDLYGHIDRLELYPGLHAEGVVGDGFGNYAGNPLRVSTMRNGLLLDAVSLIRGDRFFTTAFNEDNYTKTGFADVQRNTANKAYGGCIHKLLMRTLPAQFPEDSVYTWFPMTTPPVMKAALANSEGWCFTRPAVPPAAAAAAAVAVPVAK
ncbi:heme peroxidase [Athelia psychrophila]|uniref:Heme peroxidase n=1 Tax=Athelia psychrophila TaxID=1759441 RepID=A0A166R6Z9_9AGAM|nr:heme peroxidase [Fibularhizoctonia sp. CBS 109695]